jgi:hypothetical protein
MEGVAKGIPMTESRADEGEVEVALVQEEHIEDKGKVIEVVDMVGRALWTKLLVTQWQMETGIEGKEYRTDVDLGRTSGTDLNIA